MSSSFWSSAVEKMKKWMTIVGGAEGKLFCVVCKIQLPADPSVHADDNYVVERVKDSFDRFGYAIRHAMLYGAECLPTKRRYIKQLSVAEMRMLRWICGHTRKDRVRNDDIRERVGVAPIEEKLIQHRLGWFGHIQRRPPKAPVHSGRLKRVENIKRGRGRPNLTWEESVKRDLKV
nr:uncharacterized protein LOC127338829 [Lolium perenne]